MVKDAIKKTSRAAGLSGMDAGRWHRILIFGKILRMYFVRPHIKSNKIPITLCWSRCEE